MDRQKGLAYGIPMAIIQTHQGSYMIKNPNDLSTRRLTDIKEISLEGRTLKISGDNFNFESCVSQIEILKHGPKPDIPYSPFYEIDLMQKDERDQYRIRLRNKKYLPKRKFSLKAQ